MTSDTFAGVEPRPQQSRFRGADNLLGAVAAVLLPLGILVIVLGWYGAAHTPYLFEQVPYLISGGMVGLALVLAGGLAYFGTWIARGVASQQRSSEEIAALLREIRDGLTSREAAAPGRKAAVNGSAAFVATPGGSMLHRPDCSVVSGREDARPVAADEGLTPCGLCHPLSNAHV